MIIYGIEYRIDYILPDNTALVRRSMSKAVTNGVGSLLSQDAAEELKNDPAMQNAAPWRLGGYISELLQLPVTSFFSREEKKEYADAERLYLKFGEASDSLKRKYKTCNLTEIAHIIAMRLIGHTRIFHAKEITAAGFVDSEAESPYEHDTALAFIQEDPSLSAKVQVWYESNDQETINGNKIAASFLRQGSASRRKKK